MLPRVFRLGAVQKGEGPCFQARPGQPTAAFLLPFRHWASFFVPLHFAWAPSNLQPASPAQVCVCMPRCVLA